MLDINEMKKQCKTAYDPSLIIFMMRDYEVVKNADLLDLAWCLSNDYCHKNDAIGFCELLEKYIIDHPEQQLEK